MSIRKKGETSYKETALGVVSRSELIPLEIEGIKRAWDWILKRNVAGKLPLTTEFLKQVHKIGFAWIFPEMGGQFRKIEVTVSKHTPPKFYQVPQLMEDFLKDLNVRLKHLLQVDTRDLVKEITELLAWAHHRFLWIHPFMDYNGRISRLLTNIILLKLELPPIEMHVETRAGRLKYVEALQCADQGDSTKLQKIIFRAIRETAKELE